MAARAGETAQASTRPDPRTWDPGVVSSPADERFWTPATVVTLLRTAASLVCTALGVAEASETLLVVGLVVYWVGDMLDGAVARLLHCETRIGALMDIVCDRLNCAVFYVGLIVIFPDVWPAVAIYLFEFMAIDSFLSAVFLAWPLKSPNYFYVVDRQVWNLNWSKPAKAVNSSAFAILLILTETWIYGAAVATALLVLKVVSLRRVLTASLLPVPRVEALAGPSR